MIIEQYSILIVSVSYVLLYNYSGPYHSDTIAIHICNYDVIMILIRWDQYALVVKGSCKILKNI